MIRPYFLDQPLCWTRTPRTDQGRAEQACAIERFVRPFDPQDKIVMVGCGAALGALATLLILGAL